MRLSRKAQASLRIVVGLGMAFIYIPLIVIGIYAFNSSKILEWPPPSLTTEWFSKAFESETAREALLTSVEVGLIATAIALLCWGGQLIPAFRPDSHSIEEMKAG